MKKLAALIVTLLVMVTSQAQLPADTTISIVTFFPGRDVYELEGHTALRITTPEYDMAVSYGNFDFNSPGFLYRFVKGETDYWVEAYPWRAVQWAYQQQGRRIVQQELNLNHEQRERLISLVRENLRPENRVYRYNYVRDNCATRPLAMVEKALGTPIELSDAPREIKGLDTWRKLMTYYHRNYPWYQLGIDLALGKNLDRPVTIREKAYAPVLMYHQLESATADSHPLIQNTIILNDVNANAGADGPTPWYLTPIFVLGIFSLIISIISIRDIRRKHITRWAVCLMNIITGICGLLLTFLIFISIHEATSPNWLYLWLNPLGVVIAICIWIKKLKKLLFWLQIVNFALIMVTLLCWHLTGQHMNMSLWAVLAACMLQSAACIYILAHNRQSS